MRLHATALVLIYFFTSILAEESTPRVFSPPPGALRNRDRKGAALTKLLADADSALAVKPPSVMDKPKPGATGDRHDYLSTAPYFWPDTTKPDGLPYIRKDGQRNPESRNEFSDSPRLGRLASSAETLGYAYYFTGDEKYAEHAAKLLRVWFIDAATRMNPNFDGAQAVPGVNTGRGTGMIESRNLKAACDAASLIEASKHWSADDHAAFKKWMREFFNWARTSKNGKDEAAAKNNHGTYYAVQMAHFALFLGDKDSAKKIIEDARDTLMAGQIKPDGTQPLELAREDSFGYSRFNIQAWFELATLGDHVGIDLWHHESKDGASLRKALDFLMPYAEDPAEPWPHEREKKARRSLQSILMRAHRAYGGERYLKLLKQSEKWEEQRENLFNLKP